MLTCRVLSAAFLSALAIAVSGCGSQAAPESATQATAEATAASPASPASGQVLSVVDPWIKAADSGMTAAFATLVNNTDSEVTIVSASTPASSKVELHEVVDSGGKMVMRMKEGGITVPAGGRHQLEPGGDHIMLMDIKDPVLPGSSVAFTLTLNDGSQVEFTAVAKAFAGGNEEYGHDNHDSEDHG